MSDHDISAIVNVINLYGLAMDTQRWELFDRIYTPDVDADFGEQAHWRDLATFKRDFAAFHAPFDSTQHIMSNHVVNAAGDTATAFTYGTWRLTRKGVDGGEVWVGSGWYDDALERTPEGWRIKRRLCKVAWWSGNPLVQETLPGAKFSMRTTTLKREAAEDTVSYLRLIARK
jgi:hypothetical protein